MYLPTYRLIYLSIHPSLCISLSLSLSLSLLDLSTHDNTPRLDYMFRGDVLHGPTINRCTSPGGAHAAALQKGLTLSMIEKKKGREDLKENQIARHRNKKSSSNVPVASHAFLIIPSLSLSIIVSISIFNLSIYQPIDRLNRCNSGVE